MIAIIANATIGVSLVWDKILLRKPETRNLASYVFWLGVMSVLGLALIPFGFKPPSAAMAWLGFGSGVIHLGANWFYYRALKYGEASQSLAIVGGFAPLATVLIAIVLLSSPARPGERVAFVLMVLGGFVMFLSEKLNLRQVLPSVLWAAGLFGFTNVLQKLVFNATGFVTGYVLFTLGTFAGAMALLLRPVWRRQIVRHSEEASSSSKLWYFVNRFVSGVGSFLVFLAISRAHPAIVDAISGLRYAVIFLGAYLLTRFKPGVLRENFGRSALIGKSIATALVVAGLAVLAAADP
ncbi:MAG TPA: EamA family transporter [Bryobacteraceae bacterium]|nr:EamA family transporter [Bryobacteraceae bacterium]